MLRTSLCDLLGIDFPLLQAGMGGFAGPELAAAVSNAGGLGILAAHGSAPDTVRENLAELKSATSRPFGVNLLLPRDLISPPLPAEIDPELADSVQAALNPLREEVELPAASGLPKEPSRDIEEKLEILLEARIPVLSIGLGNPGPDLVERCHRQGTKVIAMVATLEDALAVEASGVDAIVAQGGEAGGHRSHFQKPDGPTVGLVGTVVLVPEVVDAVRVPVIAAGGIVDGRGLVAALALGAQGVMMGTRFLATREALAVDVYKEAVIQASSQETTVTDVASGRYARVIQNRFVDAYARTGAPVLPFGWHGSAVSDLFEQARGRQDPEHMALWAGQSAGRIHDLVSAADVVDRIRSEAQACLDRLNH